MCVNLKTLLIAISILLNSISYSQQLVYRPINPSFIGGEYYNGSWLLAEANAQNNISESVSSTSSSTDLLNDFSTSLTRSILSQLSKKILTDTFGEDTINEGTYEFGTYSIEVTDANNGVNITILDSSSGNSTEIFIPYY